jgi:hypothetical protein
VAKTQGFEGIQTTVLPHLGGFFRIVLVGCLALLQVANASGVDREWIYRLMDLANAGGSEKQFSCLFPPIPPLPPITPSHNMCTIQSRLTIGWTGFFTNNN